MASMKLALIVLLAFGAVQSQCANVPEPEPRDLDVFLAAQNAIKIVKNVINAVEKGIQESQPSIDILIKQLTPELGKAVKGLLDDALALVKKERQRIEFIIKEVEELLDAIKKIKSCTDPSKKDLEKVLGKFQNSLLGAVRTTINHHAEDIDDVKVGFKILLDAFRKIVDNTIKNVIGCIKPGHPNAQKCIESEAEKAKTDLIKLSTRILMFLGEVNDTVSEVAEELLTKVLPLVDNFKKEVNPVMKNISDCIAKMK